MAAAALFPERPVRWTTIPGAFVRASVPDHECTSKSSSLWVRDPECFIASKIHRHLYVWDKLTQDIPNRDEIIGWIDKKCVYDFVQPFKERFSGCTYDSSFPVPDCFITTTVCRVHLKNHNGSHCCRCRWRSLKGWTMCSPLVNCDATDCLTEQALIPFRLDSLVNVTRYFGEGPFSD